MEDCDTVKQYLGDKFVRGYVAVKRAEHENFKRVISSWEREFLLLSV
jgi:glutamine synthetase